MKTKLFKSIGTLVLACIMTLCVSTTAFAADQAKQDVADNVSVSDEGIMPMADTAVTGSVSAWSSTTLRPHLSSYIGFSKTIRVTTQSSGNNGGVDIELFKNGSLKSDGNWWMGTNDVGDWTLTLPSSGDYELIVHNNSDATVYVTAQWL